MSIADKLTTIAENQHRIYQAGYDKGKAEGGDEGWIGDGNTHIWISLAEGRTSPMLGCCPNGTVTVDWGDGTTPNVLTGTSLTTVKWTPTHNYAKAGDYIITLTVDGEIAFGGGSTSGGFILQHSSSADNRSRAYLNTIYRVELGNSVTSIGDYAFQYCLSMESIAIPDSVTSIGNYAFQDCYSMASIAIPNSVTRIGNYAFASCLSMESIAIPNSVTSIGNNVFQYCYSMESIAIPNSVTSIGNNVFQSCYSLASIAIPDSVTRIGNYTFYSCYSLASIAIPYSVTSIGTYTFEKCYGLRFCDLTNHTSVPTLGGGTSAFRDTPADFEIRVPASLADEWKAATNWAAYASYIVGV